MLCSIHQGAGATPHPCVCSAPGSGSNSLSGLQGLGVEEAVRPVCSILHSSLTCREQTLLSEEVGEVSVGRLARSA